MDTLISLLPLSYTDSVVVLGALVLGVVAGVVGTFAVLRQRSLVGDALAHAALPGVCAAFLLTGAKDPAALLADVEHLAPDAVVLDYLIGGEALGWQFLQMLKMHPPTAGIPVVICTAAVKQVEELRPHLDAQGIGVVLKPFDIGQLLAAVAEALARRPAAGGT